MEISRSLFIVLILLFLSGLFSEGADAAGKKNWDHLCLSCHNGTTAPDEAWLRGKYGTPDAFVQAVKMKGRQCMNIVKGDEKLIRKIGREIGIKYPPKK